MNERERIELIMRSYNLTPSQFADRTGIQRASVSHILSGRNKPSLEVMLKIYESFQGLDMKWLMTGAGEPPRAGEGVAVGEEMPLPTVEKELFPVNVAEPVAPVSIVADSNRSEKNSSPRLSAGERAVRRVQSTRPEKKQEQPSVVRRIKEIRVFYTDGTYETMLPEK